MATLHIISKDLQLRLGMYCSLFAEQYIITLLESISLLCIFIHIDLTIEYSFTLIHNNTFIQLIALAFWFLMVYFCMVVYQLLTGSQVQTV
ncbi:hypothetical protein D9M68_813760 [compost metagenome]